MRLLVWVLILPGEVGDLRSERKWWGVVGKRECLVRFYVGVLSGISSLYFVVRVTPACVFTVPWFVLLGMIRLFVLGSTSVATIEFAVTVGPITSNLFVCVYRVSVLLSILGHLLKFSWKVSWAW